MRRKTSLAGMTKTPLFYVFLSIPLIFPLQLVATDYLSSEYAVPVVYTAGLYLVGLPLYLYGITAPFTRHTDTTRASLVKLAFGLLGSILLYANFVSTLARACVGFGGTCG